MIKVQKISNYQHKFQYKNSEENFQEVYNGFLSTNLGKIYQSIPWDDLVRDFCIKKSKKGPISIFSPKGKIALMFLKHYACCSDERLIEQLNGNVYYQIFCDIILSPGEQIKNFKIVSQIRCELSKNLNIRIIQKTLLNKWNRYMKELNHITIDATCYESELRFPTDQKLLWECVDWLNSEIKLVCKYLKIRQPRTKYLKWEQRYFAYNKKRRKSSKQRIVLTRSLLKLLDKLNTELDRIESSNKFEVSRKYKERRSIIKEVYKQQYRKFTTGEIPSNRIVSISKSYVRPIVRGKEVKKVEFGAKVNKIQVDGINLIEHIDFEAFNEGTRFQSSIMFAQDVTRRKTSVAGADAIYATNKNRKYATKNNISTDFCRKGRAGKHEEHRLTLAKFITKERASRLEGSFGKEKEHYHLKKIKARTKQNEILWIFFGIHTANALEIGRRMSMCKLLKTA